ncbi:MAG: hypothetical protein ABI999_17370 [Acidobacteriota bacterium]
MKATFFSFLTLVLFTMSVVAQNPAAVKIDEVDIQTAGSEVFEVRAEAFLKAIMAAEKNTTGLITLYDNDETARKLEVHIATIPTLKNRVLFFSHHIIYQKKTGTVEFWLLPEGAEEPYLPECTKPICWCPDISIIGSNDFRLSDNELVFKAQINGGDRESVSYEWKVDGGDIVAGTGTATITVKPTISDPKDLKVVLDLGGLDPGCNCPIEATFTSKFLY